MAEVKIAVWRRRRREDENGPASHSLAAALLRRVGRPRRVAPIDVDEQQIVVADIPQDMGLERLEEYHRAGLDAVWNVVDDDFAPTAQDDEHLRFVMAMGRRLPPDRDMAEARGERRAIPQLGRAERGHIDTE